VLIKKLKTREPPRPGRRAGALLPFVLVCASAVAGPGAISPPYFPAAEGRPQKHLQVLLEIYREVKELGPYPGEDFIRREFFVGKDDDDTNKNTHIVVIIQNLEGRERMRLQVTYMEPSRSDPQVKYARSVKNLACVVDGENVSIRSSDYGERELDRLTPDILRAVLDKKKILKLQRGGEGEKSRNPLVSIPIPGRSSEKAGGSERIAWRTILRKERTD
jgi:hypothetical protein